MFLIRSDGNARIGAGHLMRCLTIAQELALLRGIEEICFLCADEESAALVRDNGFPCHVLGTDYRDMESELPQWEGLWRKLQSGNAASLAEMSGSLGEASVPEKESAFLEGISREVPAPKEASAFSEEASALTEGDFFPGRMAVRKYGAVILVDSYYVTDSYLAALGRMAYVVLMDDMGTHRYPADCVVNYNAPADYKAYRRLYQGSTVRLLIGSRYVPLRRQFTDEGAGGGAKPEQPVRDVLITTGGGDSENIAGKILDKIYSDAFSFHLVTGRFNPFFRELKELEGEHSNIHIHHDVKDMAGLMRRCQIALTAGGSTVYELAALGVPFICFSYAENQEALVEYVGSRQIAGSVGAWHRDQPKTLETIGRLFKELAADPGLRRSYSESERAMTDGKGAGRLAQEIADLARRPA